jgi:hypothetical protein
MKLFNRTVKTAPLSRQEALRCAPTPNLSVIASKLESGDILLEYEIPMRPFLKSLQKHFQGTTTPPRKKLQLDSMGTLVWEMIDGDNSTRTIIKKFAEHYTVSLHEAETSVTAFLLELGKRGLIGMK